jgi:type I restriction enzyme S subunit
MRMPPLRRLAMSEPGSGWKRVKFGDVVVNSTTATKTPVEDGFTRYIVGKHIPEDCGRINSWNEVGDGEFGSRIRTIFKAGDIICTTRGPKLRVAVAEFDGLSAHTNFILRTKDSSVLLQEYLEAVARSDGFQAHLRGNFRGSTNLFVNWSDAARFEFALPAMRLQQRACRMLEAAQLVTDASWEAWSAACSVYRSLLFSTFAPDRSAVLNVSPASWKPASWPIVPLGELTPSDAPICYGIVQPGESVEGGVPTATSNNLNIGFETSIHLTSPTIERGYERSRVLPGDILIAVKGFGTGKVGIIPKCFRGNITRDLARIRLPRPADSRFFLHLWRSAPFEWYRKSTSVGTTRPELSIGTLREMLVPWPDSSTRERVANRLDQVERTTLLAAQRKQDAVRFQQYAANAALDSSGGF